MGQSSRVDCDDRPLLAVLVGDRQIRILTTESLRMKTDKQKCPVCLGVNGKHGQCGCWLAPTALLEACGRLDGVERVHYWFVTMILNSNVVISLGDKGKN
jgi:hypothetical protein